MHTEEATHSFNGAGRHVVIDLLLAPRYRLARHLLLIGLFVGWIYSARPEFSYPAANYVRGIAITYLLVPVYINMYLLVPRLLFRKRYLVYAISVLLMISVLVLIARGIDNAFKAYRVVPRPGGNSALHDFIGFNIIFCVILAASTAVRLFGQWIRDNMRIAELEKYNMQSELNQLKSQINPHFLFNVLNNVNVLTRKDPEKASQALYQLSDLLRYQLYDSAQDKVLLSSEINFLNDFLNLEKNRRDNFRFTIATQGNSSGIMIPPFLFITFVENAVKHNVYGDSHAYADLSFEIRPDTLVFTCSNSKPAAGRKPAVNTGGIGLANINRRLKLLYPDAHQLQIEDKESLFTVNLEIPL